MKTKLLSLLLAALFLFSVAAIPVAAAEIPAPEEAYVSSLISKLRFCVMLGGVAEYEPGTAIPDRFAYTMSQLNVWNWEQYAKEDNAYEFDVPYSEYVAFLDSTFRTHTDMKDYFKAEERYDEAKDTVTVSGTGLGGPEQYVIVQSVQDGNECKLYMEYQVLDESAAEEVWEVKHNAVVTLYYHAEHGWLLDGYYYVDELIPELPFTDVAQGKWYEDAVNYAVSNGLFNGVSETEFAPNTAMTRAMLVSVLYRIAGEPELADQTNPFMDVEAGRYYTNAVLWASANGVVNGVSDGVFAPANSITREQMATILYRYSSQSGLNTEVRLDLTLYPDGDAVSGYARDAFAWACGEELISGVLNGGVVSLNPKGNATRAQVATILMRYELNVAK